MIQTLTIFLLIGMAALALLVFAFIVLIRAFVAKEAGFFRSPWMAVNILENFLSLDEESYLYDLGCGDGRVMRAFFERYPKAHYLGVEKNLFPFISFYLQNRRVIGDRFDVMRANLFDVDLSDATHVFVYLLPPMMDKLESKLEDELKGGALVVSLDFPFRSRQPKETVKFFDKSKQDRFIYIYEF